MESSPIMQKLLHLIQSMDTLAEQAIFYKASCQDLAVSMNLLETPLKELQESKTPLNFEDLSILNRLELTATKLKDLLESCGGRAGKSIIVIGKQQVFKELSTSLQFHLSSLPLDTLSLSEHSKDLVQECLKSLQSIDFHLSIAEEHLCKEVGSALAEIKKGTRLSHGMLVRLADLLKLTSNQEVLREASLLEKEKQKAHTNKNKGEEEQLNLLIVLLTQMSDDLADQKQVQAQEGGIVIPADFRCPLSLELMSDPVIVASGQTYERAHIQKWLAEGNTTCPKSRQTLNHFNLINNFTVKAWIASWCEQSGVPLPVPDKQPQLPPPAQILATQRPVVGAVSTAYDDPAVALSESRPAARSMRTLRSRGEHLDTRRESGAEVGSLDDGRGSSHGDSRFDVVERENVHSPLGQEEGNLVNGTASHSRNTSASSHGSSFDDISAPANVETNLRLSNDLSPYCSDVSGELGRLTLADDVSAPANLETNLRSSNNLSPYCSDVSGELRSLTFASVSSRNEETVSHSTTLERNPISRSRENVNVGVEVSQGGADTAGEDEDDIQLRVQVLVRDLSSSSSDVQRNAATELRLLAKYNVENRITIANSGAIPPLVSLLHSTDPQIQENAVTALLNLSINNNNKSEIAAASAFDPLVHVLNVGTSEARENAAATLFSLSVMDENRMAIGESGAIKPLVDLLIHGTPRGKKDAATALFNLSILHDNKSRIVHAKAVRPLVRLMSDPAAGMVDKAVAVIANLATIQEGRNSIGEEDGIPALVEVVEMGSQRGKENAAAALLHLCTNSNRFKSRVFQEGVYPPLVALTKSGTPRAKEKASALLRLFREQRSVRGGGGIHADRRR